MKKSAANPGRSFSNPSYWRAAAKLLGARQYEEVARLLYKVQVASEQTDNAVFTDILAAARSVCLALVACQMEVMQHQQAGKEAERREQELREQLYTILDLVSRRELPKLEEAERAEPPRASAVEMQQVSRDLTGSVARPSLWQRLRNFLRGRAPPQPPPRGEFLEVLVEQLTGPTAEESETAIDSFPKRESEVIIEFPIERTLPPSDESVEAVADAIPEPSTTATAFPAEVPKPSHIRKAEVVVDITPEPEPAATIISPVERVAPSSVEKAEVVVDVIPELVPVAPILPAKKDRPRQQPLPSLVIYCLGQFRVYQNDQLIVKWRSLKGQAIFKYLLMRKGGPVAKDILMDVFWPNVDPSDTRRNLHQAIYGLRQTLRQKQATLRFIRFENNCYLLDPEVGVWLDFEEFERRVQAGRRLEAAGALADAMAEYSIAEGLYQGDFLEEHLYEDWPRLQREYFKNLYLDIADRLGAYYLRQNAYTAAIALCQKILTKDNCREEVYRRLMRCYMEQGQRYLAIRQYQTCVQALKEELDLAPSEETVKLYQRISTGA